MRLAPASRLVVAYLLVAAFPASGLLTLSSASSTLSGAAPQTQGIIITGWGADPQVVTITVGTAVEWRNRDDIAHTITSDDGSFGPFSVPSLDVSATTPFTVAGTYTYTIDKVPNPTGAIIVLDTGPSPTATTSPTSTASPLPAEPSSTPMTSATPGAPATDTPTSPPPATNSATGTPTATDTPTPTATDTSTPTATSTPYLSDTALVTITYGGFIPHVVTITLGMYVRWTNVESSPVTVTTMDKTFVMGPIQPGGISDPLPFRQSGTYPYILDGSPDVTGTVIVQDFLPTPTATASDTPTPTATASDTPTPTATASDTPTPTATALDTPTITPAASGTDAPTGIPTPSATGTPTGTPTPTSTTGGGLTSPTATPSARYIITPTPTPTQTASATPMPGSTPTQSPTPTPTSTSTRLSTPAAPAPTAPATLAPGRTPSAPASWHIMSATASPTITPGAGTTSRRPRPPRTQPPACPSTLRRGVSLELSARGYAWRRRARIDLVLVLTVRAGSLRGSLRLRDPAAHLMLTSIRFDRLRLICHGVRVDGLGQTAHRRIRFFVIAEAGRRTMTLGIAVPGLGYRLNASVPGHLNLRMPRRTGAPPNRRSESPTVSPVVSPPSSHDGADPEPDHPTHAMTPGGRDWAPKHGSVRVAMYTVMYTLM